MIKTSISRSCKQITSMVSKGMFSFDNVVQRGYVWNKSQKSNLIHSIIEDYPIPAVYAKKDGKVYDVLDGKQRLSTIASYMSDEFALSKLDAVSIETDTSSESVKFHISGKKFSQLPLELQEKISSYMIEIYSFDGITDEQVTTLFKKLNNGKPLTPKDRNIVNCPEIAKISEIGNHDVFKAVLSKRALANRIQIPIIMKIWSLFYTENRSFESRTFNKVIGTISISPEQESEINYVLDKALEVYNNLESKAIRKKFSTETHFVSLAPLFRKAVNESIPTESLVSFINEFFNSDTDATISSAYNDAAKSGAAKSTNVEIRNMEVINGWNLFENERG